MAELRTYTLSFNTDASSGITGIKQLTMALSDAKATEEMLNNELGNGITVSAKNIKSKKEIEQQTKLLVRQQEQAVRSFENVSAALQLEINSVGKTTTQQELLTAVHRLGANATDAQKESISQLVAQLATLRAAEQARVASEQSANQATTQLAASYDKVTNSLRLEIDSIGKTANQLAVLNQVRQLGANATDAQKEEVAQLVAQLATLRAAEQARVASEQSANQATLQSTKYIEQLNSQLQLERQYIGQSREAIERLNAVHRLGANATSAQREQVVQLITALQQNRAQVEQSQGSLRNFRGVLQNVGWQVQDTAVQMQMGTNAFVVMSQQGSQLASSFGPNGALIGAFIAVAGVVAMQLWPSLKNAGTAAEQVDKVFQSVNKTMKDGANDADIYTESFVKLYNANKSLGLLQLRLELSKLDSASTIASEGISKSIGKIGDDVLSVPVVQMDGFTQVNSGVLQITGTMGNSAPVIDGYAKSLLDLKTVSTDINKNGFNDQNIKAYESALLSVSKTGDIANKDLQAFLQTNNEILVSQISITNKKKELQKALSELGVSDKPLLTPQQKQETKDTLKDFDYLSNALIKKTETTQEEYLRQKAIIDKAAKTEGSDSEKIKAAYAALEEWKTTTLQKESDKRNKISNAAYKKEDSEYQSLLQSLIKKTNTTQEEYDRQKAIIDAHVLRVGSTDATATQAYIALKKWETGEYQKEYDKREAVRKQIEAAQDTQFGKSDPTGQENDLFAENTKKLEAQKLANNLSLQEEMRIDALMEKEGKRHTDKLAKIEQAQKLSSLEAYGAFTNMLSQTFGQLENAAAEGSNAAKTLFYVNRAIALANTIINTEAAAMKAVGELPVFGGIAMSTAIRAQGYAAAGIIAGTTFAGAYDAGGYIPSGSAGIVSEYADELVNGTLVQGPAHVTSSAKTAQKMGTTLNVQVANQIDGATYDVQQIDEETVKIIARRELSKNIDKSVASVMSNPNSRTRKATSSSYSLKRKF